MRKFLQGMGIGILLTTLVFTIAYLAVGKRDLTDAQIIARAKKLGMTERQEDIFSNQDHMKDVTQEGASVLPDTPDSVNAAEPDQTVNEPETSQEPGQEPQTTKEDENGNLEDQTLKNQSNENEDEHAESDNSDDARISFKIDKGEEATQISRRLERVGVVDDAVKFDAYLRDNNVSRSIQIGTFELHSNMSYEELARILSGKS